jgi:isochorismate synthase EntC
MKLANIQHLCTPLVARLAPGASLLDLVERLHPTPAVGGWPRPEALEAIRRLEDMDRGWYAGPVGWIDPTGNGEFVVGLRTALVGDGTARLYAGAGIVCDSLPADELEEIETKLDALRGVIVR